MENSNKIKSVINSVQCNPCANAIIINTANSICKLSDKLATNNTCNKLHEAAIFESIPIDKYLLSIQRICSEKQSKDAIQSLLSTFRNNGFSK